jgi:tetratricopeptide (TPR) repeat protein
MSFSSVGSPFLQLLLFSHGFWPVSPCTRTNLSTHFSGDLPAAGALADQALELALREGSPTHLGLVYLLQTETRRSRGDLAGSEKYYAAGFKFFDDPGFRRVPGAASGSFGYASFNACNAWALGRTDVARQRMARAMAAANGNNPYEVAFSKYLAAMLRVYLREYEPAEALAERALELSEKHQFKTVAAYSRWTLGQARARLGRATEGIALIRQGLAGLGEIGTRLGISLLTASLAEAQESGGAVVEALETAEQALQVNPDLLASRPEMLRLRGNLRLKLGQTEADFREAIALAQRISAKTLELRASISLARLLSEQARCDEARAMLADIYGWFTEGFDTADLKDAKALLEELSA